MPPGSIFTVPCSNGTSLNKPHYHAAGFEHLDDAITNVDGRQMPAIGVVEQTCLRVVHAEEEGRIALIRAVAEQMPVQVRNNFGGIDLRVMISGLAVAVPQNVAASTPPAHLPSATPRRFPSR